MMQCLHHTTCREQKFRLFLRGDLSFVAVFVRCPLSLQGSRTTNSKLLLEFSEIHNLLALAARMTWTLLDNYERLSSFSETDIMDSITDSNSAETEG